MISFFKKPTETLVDDIFFAQLRKTEYANLDKQHQTYLDFTGGNLYGKSQIIKHQELLLQHILVEQLLTRIIK